LRTPGSPLQPSGWRLMVMKIIFGLMVETMQKDWLV